MEEKKFKYQMLLCTKGYITINLVFEHFTDDYARSELRWSDGVNEDGGELVSAIFFTSRLTVIH